MGLTADGEEADVRNDWIGVGIRPLTGRRDAAMS